GKRPGFGQSGEALAFGLRHFLLQSAALVGGDFDGARKPAGEGAVEQRVADKKHEEHRQQRNNNGADNHFAFATGAEWLAAAFGPRAEDGAGDDQSEKNERCGNERGNSVEGENVAPTARFEGRIKRAERENGSE